MGELPPEVPKEAESEPQLMPGSIIRTDHKSRHGVHKLYYRVTELLEGRIRLQMVDYNPDDPASSQSRSDKEGEVPIGRDFTVVWSPQEIDSDV